MVVPRAPRGLVTAVVLAATIAAFGPPAWAQGAVGRQSVVFTQAAPRAANLEIARRLLSPLVAARLDAAMAREHTTLNDQPLDLAHENFLIYVPRRAPPHGYGLFVFIPPWEDARLPDGWAPVFEAQGVIFVTAARSGNAQSVFGRRIPLALSAEHNVEQAYPIDPARIYIGGFSGGSRVAMRVALGNADLFRGAILNAGSDPIGGRDAPIPPAAVLAQAQDHLHIVYLTGDQDREAFDMDAESQGAMKRWCVFGLAARRPARNVHDVASGADMNAAFLALAAAPAAKPDRIAACRARLQADVRRELAAARALADHGDLAKARKAIIRIDQLYGGLVGPELLDLSARLGGD